PTTSAASSWTRLRWRNASTSRTGARPASRSTSPAAPTSTAAGCSGRVLPPRSIRGPVHESSAEVLLRPILQCGLSASGPASIPQSTEVSVMSKRNVGKWMAIGLAVAAAVAMPLSASAHDHDGWGHGGGWGHHGWHDGGWGRGGYHGGYYRHGGGYWSGGRWIAGAIVTGVVAGVVSDALAPRPVYYGPAPVVYGPPTVVYEDAPVVTRRVVTRTVVYDDGPTRYVRDDGYDGD